jgi:hypothetical protein
MGQTLVLVLLPRLLAVAVVVQQRLLVQAVQGVVLDIAEHLALEQVVKVTQEVQVLAVFHHTLLEAAAGQAVLATMLTGAILVQVELVLLI